MFSGLIETPPVFAILIFVYRWLSPSARATLVELWLHKVSSCLWRDVKHRQVCRLQDSNSAKSLARPAMPTYALSYG